MPKWTVVFYPPSGARFSPVDSILSLDDEAERGQIAHRLETMAKLDVAQWPHTWVHKITGKVFQLTAGDNRVMYCLDEKRIVVLHVCRKVRQKALAKDIKRAKSHYDSYFTQKKGD